jgi:hypothetical protein
MMSGNSLTEEGSDVQHRRMPFGDERYRPLGRCQEMRLVPENSQATAHQSLAPESAYGSAFVGIPESCVDMYSMGRLP